MKIRIYNHNKYLFVSERDIDCFTEFEAHSITFKSVRSIRINNGLKT